MLLGAALVAGVYLLSPTAAVRRVHTFIPQRSLGVSLADVADCGLLGCPPPPPPEDGSIAMGMASGPTHPPAVTRGSRTHHMDDLTALSFLSTPPSPAVLASTASPLVLQEGKRLWPPVKKSTGPALGCDANGECSVEALVARHAVDNTVVATFGNARQVHFTENWVYHLRRLGVGGLLVGMMNMQHTQPRYVRVATKLRALGVGVYTVNSYEVKRQPQGGRWFHVLPLLRTGARVLLSDSDVVWFRDPLPYLKHLEALHPRLDFTISSDLRCLGLWFWLYES